MSSSTSLRSLFWLTDRLGRTSHLTNKVGLGEIETVKHPSPSTYPEMYDGRSTRPCREPAYCSGHRFATLQPYGWGVTATRSLVLSDSVVTGPYLLAQAEGFPRHYPPSIASFLIEAAGVGFAVMSGIYPRDHSRGGQVGYLPDKEFRSSPPHVAMRLGPSLQLTRRRELAGVWPL